MAHWINTRSEFYNANIELNYMKKKISLIGAGQIGGTLAHLITIKELADVVLFDIDEGLAKGKALDIAQSTSVSGSNINLIGTSNYEDTKNSDVIIITAGIPRKLGMSRDDLLGTNLKIKKQVAEGIKKTIDRAKAYEDAGADIIFPEAMRDEKEFELIRKNLKVNLLANMTEFGKSKLLSTIELENLGYNIVIYPVTTQRLAMKSVEEGLRTIMSDGHQNNIIDKMQTRKRLYELVEYEKYNTPGKKITDFKTDGHE